MAVANGEADIAIANSYYIGIMLSGSAGQEQQEAANKEAKDKEDKELEDKLAKTLVEMPKSNDNKENNSNNNSDNDSDGDSNDDGQDLTTLLTTPCLAKTKEANTLTLTPKVPG